MTMSQAASSPVNGVVAVVNDDIITVAELRSYLQPLANSRKLTRQLIDTTLEELINNRLLLQAAKAEDITVSADQVNSMIWERINDFENETAYLHHLMQDLNMTLRQQKDIIEAQLMRRKLIEKVLRNELYVPPREIRAYYNKHRDSFEQPERRRVSMISVDFNRYPDKASAKAKIDGIRKRLIEGEDFAALARECSDDPKAEEGGDYGLIEKDRWILADKAFSLSKNQLSDVLETRLGYHIVRVEEVHNSRQRALDQVQTEIVRILRHQYNDAMIEEYVKKLRDKAYVQRFNDDVERQLGIQIQQ